MAGCEQRRGRRVAAHGDGRAMLEWRLEVVSIACALAVAGCPWSAVRAQSTTPGNPGRALAIPANLQIAELNAPVFALSPDGRNMVFEARDRAHQQLYLRGTKQDEPSPEPKPLAGTDRAEAPFFSPDG